MDPHKESVVNQLHDMGFEPALVEKAYARADIKTVEGLVNFIEAHPNLQNEPDAPAPAQGGHEGEAPGQSISGHVNQELVAQLVSLGFSKDTSEKALFLTGNNSVEAAKEWLAQHKDEPDFNEPLFIVMKPDAPKLTPEEAKKKAKELQAKIREERAKKDKIAELEAEKLRLQSNKGLTDAHRQLQELQTKLDMENLKRQREEDAKAKQKILDEIEKDRLNKGLKPHKAIIKPIHDLFPDMLKKMQRVYPDNQTVKTCLSTIKIYLNNFISNPQEEKFRKINGENANFKARVGDIIGGRALLKEVGFEENGAFLEIHTNDPHRAQDLVKEIDNALTKMN